MGIEYSDDLVNPTIQYVHDRLGRVKTVYRGNSIHAQYTYNGPGMSLSQEDLNQDTALPKTLIHHRDTYLRPESLAVTGDYTTGYGYDTAGRLDRVWHHPVLDNGVPEDPHTFTYAYEDDSYHLISSVTGPVHTVTNQWETTRDVLDKKFNQVTVGTSALVSSFHYTVNAIGQRTHVAPAAAGSAGTMPTHQVAWTWGYNNRGELVYADHGSDGAPGSHDRFYQFDSIGNRNHTRYGVHLDSGGTFFDYTANALNQYTVAHGVTLPAGGGSPPVRPAYDADGNYPFASA